MKKLILSLSFCMVAMALLPAQTIEVKGQAALSVPSEGIIYSIAILDTYGYGIDRENEEYIKLLREILQKLKIEKYEVESFEVNSFEEEDEGITRVKIDDLTTLRKLITQLRRHQLFVGRIYKVLPGDVETLKQELKVLAIQDARTTAETMLQDVNAEIENVKTIRDLGIRQIDSEHVVEEDPYLSKDYYQRGDNAAVHIRLVATVEVTFNIKYLEP